MYIHTYINWTLHRWEELYSYFNSWSTLTNIHSITMQSKFVLHNYTYVHVHMYANLLHVHVLYLCKFTAYANLLHVHVRTCTTLWPDLQLWQSTCRLPASRLADQTTFKHTTSFKTSWPNHPSNTLPASKNQFTKPPSNTLPASKPVHQITFEHTTSFKTSQNQTAFKHITSFKTSWPASKPVNQE